MPVQNIKRLWQRHDTILELISPEVEHPGKHFKEANDLIVDMANAGLDPSKLSERLYFLTEGWTEKDRRPARERMREILQWKQTSG